MSTSFYNSPVAANICVQDIACLIQPSSADKPAVKNLTSQGLKVVIADLTSSVEDLAKAIAGYDTVISAIGATQQKDQLSLVDACALAGTKRFLPCAFMTVCPPGGIMHLRDDKEVVYQRIWQQKVPYTIIDVGYWHQISIPRLPSGRIDAQMLIPRDEVYGDGEMKTIITDKRDIGRWVARIIADPRTLNQKVIAYSDVLSQNEILQIMEEKSGEKIETIRMTDNELLARLEKVRADAAAHPEDFRKRIARSGDEYSNNKYVRGDNTPQNAKYLGYLDATELYPDTFAKVVKFEQFIDELLEGKGKKPYVGRW